LALLPCLEPAIKHFSATVHEVECSVASPSPQILWVRVHVPDSSWVDHHLLNQQVITQSLGVPATRSRCAIESSTQPDARIKNVRLIINLCPEFSTNFSIKPD
jgi:hypothetical protein